MEQYEAKGNVGQPPPGHTRGKWVPGAQTDIESGYWCSPCGRKLASRLVYNRHLLSDLHARRSIREIDGVPCLPRTATLHATKRTPTRNQVTIRAVIVPVNSLLDNHHPGNVYQSVVSLSPPLFLALANRVGTHEPSFSVANSPARLIDRERGKRQREG